MRPTQSRLLAATAIIAVGTMTLGACAQSPSQEVSAPRATTSSPSETPSPAPTPSVGADGETVITGSATPPRADEPADEAAPVELVDFETQNGTMRMRVPADWTVEDRSHIALNAERTQQWDNIVSVSSADGGHLWFSDGAWDAVGVSAEEVSVVEQIAMGDGLAATAWWQRIGDQYFAYAAVVEAEGAPSFDFRAGDGTRLLSLAFAHSDVLDAFPSADAAEAYLRGDAVALALDVMATAEFTGEDDALPDGVGVEHEGTTYLPYTTQNGTASFLVPLEWAIRDSSSAGTNRAGEQVWNNSVALEWLPLGMMLHYGDMEFTNIIEEWEWSLGEVRPTKTPGWQAVSWTLGDSVPHYAGNVGVSLSDQGGAVRPADTVCSERMCRSFTSLPTPPHWYREDGLDGPEDFFGSAAEERLLTVVASLETHHDDPMRMP